jgi:hypothetical protein
MCVFLVIQIAQQQRMISSMKKGFLSFSSGAECTPNGGHFLE